MARRRITMDLDDKLLKAVDLEATHTHTSRNQFIVRALTDALRQRERQRVDEAFAEMEHDEAYQHEMLDLERELGPASDEVWRRMEYPHRPAGA